MPISEKIYTFAESKFWFVVSYGICVTSLLALARSSETVPLRLLPPPTVHFKIRVPTFALVLWHLLADAGLGLYSFDVGTGFLRGQGLSWTQFRFYT